MVDVENELFWMVISGDFHGDVGLNNWFFLGGDSNEIPVADHVVKDRGKTIVSAAGLGGSDHKL